MSDLLKINVNEHTEKKGGLTYLSWAWAWAEVLKHDPLATWLIVDIGKEGDPFMRLPDGTVLVMVSVTIKGISRSCHLPVMDNRNNAIKNPDARKISDAIMRCMTKAIAMHGLGLYIYAGEDLPESDQTDSLVPVLEASIEQEKQKRQGVMGAVLASVESYLDDATKTGLIKLGREVSQLYERKDEGVGLAFDRVEIAGLNGEEKTYLWSLLDSKVRTALKREREIRQLKGAHA